jgi:hypothetical protein
LPETTHNSPADAKALGFRPLGVILAITSLLYVPTLRFGFVYDDQVQVLHNPRITSWMYFQSYFRHHLWAQISQFGSYFRPLFLVWLRLNNSLFGSSSVGWHASTLLLHLVAIAMVYLLLRRTMSDSFVVVVATAIFALHPAHIESVAWISGLTDPLMTIPLIGSLLCWLRYRERKQVASLIVSLLLLLTALMVKETAAITPFLLFAYAHAMSREEDSHSPLRDAARTFVPYALVLAGYLVVRWRALRGEYSTPVRPLGEAIVNLPAMTWFYVRHLLWPLRLSVIYDFDLSHRRGVLVIAAIAVIAIVMAAGILAARRSGALLMAWAWIVFPIVPAIVGVTAFDPHDFVHDRYLYLPTLGLGILLGVLLRHLQIGTRELFGKPAMPTAAALLVLGGLAYATETQLAPWMDNLTLFTHAIQVAPTNPMGYEHLAFEMYRRNDAMAAVNLYKKAVALDPNDYRANFGLAVLLYRLQDWQGANIYCGQADRIAPDSNNVCYQFQTDALMHLGEWQAAELPIRRAIALWPQEPGQHLRLGRILAHEGKSTEAQRELLQELQIDPTSTAARGELQQLNDRQ